MPTTGDGYNFWYPNGDVLFDHTDYDTLVLGVVAALKGLGVILAPSGGFSQASDAAPTAVPTELSVTVSPYIAIVGSGGDLKVVVRSTSLTLDTSNADGVPVASSTNYFFLKQDGTWHIDQDNTPPAKSLIGFTGVADADDFTSFNALPTGRVNLDYFADVVSSLAAISGVNTPATITANQNDYSLPESARFHRLATDASRNITGFAGGTSGRYVVIVNVGANNIVIKNQDAASAAANRIITGTGADVTIGADGIEQFFYDSASSRWRMF